MNLTNRMDRVEAMLSQHLEESGAIRNDLTWIKKAMYGVYGLGATILVTIVGALAAHAMQ